MILNLRDCSAGSPEVDAGLVWGRKGNGTAIQGNAVSESYSPNDGFRHMASLWVRLNIAIQIQLLLLQTGNWLLPPRSAEPLATSDSLPRMEPCTFCWFGEDSDLQVAHPTGWEYPPRMAGVWLLPVLLRLWAWKWEMPPSVKRTAFEVSAFIFQCFPNKKWQEGIKCNLFTSPGGSFPNTIAVPGSRPSPEETKGKKGKPN